MDRWVTVTLMAVLVGFGWLADRLRPPSHAAVLTAIRLVESSGRDDCPDGDDGRAIGPFQIHEPYWRDAVAHEPALADGHGYRDCRDRAYAELVVTAYMRRWVPEAWVRRDAETIARTHNGGPDGANDPATAAYWERVRAHLR